MTAKAPGITVREIKAYEGKPTARLSVGQEEVVDKLKCFASGARTEARRFKVLPCPVSNPYAVVPVCSAAVCPRPVDHHVEREDRHLILPLGVVCKIPGCSSSDTAVVTGYVADVTNE